MALTRDFKETIKERAQNDPAFRVGLLTEAAECILNDEANVAKTLLRDYVNATIGFQELGALTDRKPQSLMRMLSEKGNPSLGNISKLIASLRQHEGVELRVVAGA
ncbi:MAG: helix-turn-helix domain-containing transcriptional regulator [Alphaproteobacteria bacterium]